MTGLGPLQFLAQREFYAGLVSGAATLVVVLSRPPTSSPAPVGGMLFAGTAGLAMGVMFGFDAGLGFGLVALAASGVLADLGYRWLLVAPVALVGAVLVAFQGHLVGALWIRLAVAVVALFGGLLTADFDRRWRSTAFGPVLLAVSVVGVYYTVPDTREALVMLGAVIPLLLLAWPRRLVSLGAGGAMAATGLLVWVVATGGFGRQSSIVGGMGCLGLLVVEPLARVIHRGWSPLDHVRHRLLAAPLVAGVHLVLVYVSSRVAGLREPEAVGPGHSLARGGIAEAGVIVALEVAVALGAFAHLHRAVVRGSMPPPGAPASGESGKDTDPDAG